MSSNRMVADPTEAVWRADWEKHWAYAREAGWTRIDGPDDCGGVWEHLRPDADCTRRMGGLTVDYRAVLGRLQGIGTIRGWLGVTVPVLRCDEDGNPLRNGDACSPCERGRHSNCQGCLCACASALKSISWAAA